MVATLCLCLLALFSLELLELRLWSGFGGRCEKAVEERFITHAGIQVSLHSNCSYPKEQRIPNVAAVKDARQGGRAKVKAVNSISGTTGAGVPTAVWSMLVKNGESLEGSDSDNGMEEAVAAKVKECGWNPSEISFVNKKCVSELGFDPRPQKMPISFVNLVDIVMASSRDLDYLDEWREFLQGIHFIILQDGNPNKVLNIPEWVDYELYTRSDVARILKHDAWIFSSKDTALINFGFLVSKKPMIYTIRTSTSPASRSDGRFVNPLHLHIRNLLTPSTPYYFNTLYDPFLEENDFVRGYPYSLRGGAVTGISHGLWLGFPDYDAATQLLKMKERNHRFLDTTITIPVGTLYSMSSMNLAFSRDKIGPACMLGLMGDGQHGSSYSDIFGGWASKTVADHLGLGVKSGQPYVLRRNVENPLKRLGPEIKSLRLQEELIRFLANELKLPGEADNAVTTYRALAIALEANFKQKYPLVGRLATAMRVWTNLWKNASTGSIHFVPSRKSTTSVASQYPELNTGELSWTRNQLLTHPAYKGLFETFGTLSGERVVTDDDLELGRSWKTYLLPLPPSYHQDVFNRFARFGCLLNACEKNTTSRLPFHYEDHEAEAIILRKFLASLEFTENPEEADMILVPALSVTVANTRWYGMPNQQGCRSEAPCEDAWFKALFREVEKLKRSFRLKSSAKFVYLSSIDSAIMHKSYVRLLRDKSSIVLTYGSSGMVIPSLNNEMQLQPGHRQKWLSLEERDIFIFVNFGVRHPIREQAVAQLKKYHGAKNVVWANPGNRNKKNPHVTDAAPRSIFIFCLPGDFPFQKRFYDALANGVIPVVARIDTQEGGAFTHFYLNKVIRRHFGPNRRVDTPTIENMYPMWNKVLGMSVLDVVIEVDYGFFLNGTMMEFLESIPQATLRKKLQNIKKLRDYAIYNFEGSAPDAFSVILRSIGLSLQKFKPVPIDK